MAKQRFVMDIQQIEESGNRIVIDITTTVPAAEEKLIERGICSVAPGFCSIYLKPDTPGDNEEAIRRGIRDAISAFMEAVRKGEDQ